MRIHLCGVRGSTPAPGPEFVRYGGHTSCLALADGDGPPTLLLDAGTGIRDVTALGDGTPFRGTILLTHLHWDHVQGLPFFAAGDRPDARVRVALPEQPDGADALSVLARAMSPPHFPIRPDGLQGDWTFTTIGPGETEAEGFSVVAHQIPHKGGTTLGYRISDRGTTLAYLPDHCPSALGPGPAGWGEYHPAALELADGADVLVHDAQLLPEDADQQDFGHAVADYALGLARRTGVRRTVLFHHHPDRTDDDLDALGARLGVEVAAQGSVLEP
jgi:phosphoribosyl 1,2-cyclic phosphodiesterase